jgi:hypothetical protein
MPIIPAVGRLRQEDSYLEASLGYLGYRVKHCLKNQNRGTKFYI